MPLLEAVSNPPVRADVWHSATPHCQVHYQLLAEAEPDALCRALNLFALQFLVPLQVNVQRQDDLMTLDIVIDGLSWHRAEVIAEKLRNLISVCSVTLTTTDSQRGAAVLAVG